MDGKDVFVSAVRCEDHERTPVFLFDLTLGMKIAGYTTSSIYRNGFDGTMSGKSILAMQSELGTDAVNGSVHSMDSVCFGTEMVFPDDGTPYVKKQAFAEPESFFAHSPNEIRKETLDQIIVSHRYIREKRPDVGLIYHVPSPLSTAMMFRGIESFLMDTITEPDFTQKQIEFASDCVGIYMGTILPKIDADAVLFSGAYDNIDLVGIDSLNALSSPSLQRKITVAHENGMPVIFHPHGVLSEGDGETYLDEILDMGMDCLYYGEANDPTVLLEHTRDRSSIMGGVDTFTTIFIGPNERVKGDVNDVMRIFEGEDHIFSCSCSVDRGLDIGRLGVMVDTVRSYRKLND